MSFLITRERKKRGVGGGGGVSKTIVEVLNCGLKEVTSKMTSEFLHKLIGEM